MTDDFKIWLPPMLTLLGTLVVVVFTAWLNSRAMLTLLGTLVVVVFTAWLNSRALLAQVEALRQEFRADIATLKLEIYTALQRIENKIDHLADTQASHSARLDKLEG